MVRKAVVSSLSGKAHFSPHLHLFGFGHGKILLVVMAALATMAFMAGYFVAAQTALTVSHTDDQIITSWQGSPTTLYTVVTTAMPAWVNQQISSALAPLIGQCPSGQVIAGFSNGLNRICIPNGGSGLKYSSLVSVNPYVTPAQLLFSYTNTGQVGFPSNWTAINLAPYVPAAQLANVRMVKLRVICGETYIWMTGEGNPSNTITPVDYRRVCGAANNQADNADVDVPVTALNGQLNMRFKAQATNPSTVSVIAYLLGYYTV